MNDPWTDLLLGIFGLVAPFFLIAIAIDYFRKTSERDEKARRDAEGERRFIIHEERQSVATEELSRAREQEHRELLERQRKCDHEWSPASRSAFLRSSAVGSARCAR